MTQYVCIKYIHVHTPTIHIDMNTGINSIAGVYFTDTLYYSNDGRARSLLDGNPY